MLHQNRYSYQDSAKIHTEFLEQAQEIAELDNQYYRLLAVYAKLFEDNELLEDIYIIFSVKDNKELLLSYFEEWYSDGRVYKDRPEFILHFTRNGYEVNLTYEVK